MQRVLTIAILLRFMDSFMIYTEPFVVTGGGPSNATTFLSIDLVKIALGQFDLGKDHPVQQPVIFVHHPFVPQGRDMVAGLFDHLALAVLLQQDQAIGQGDFIFELVPGKALAGALYRQRRLVVVQADADLSPVIEGKDSIPKACRTDDRIPPALVGKQEFAFDLDWHCARHPPCFPIASLMRMFRPDDNHRKTGPARRALPCRCASPYLGLPFPEPHHEP